MPTHLNRKPRSSRLVPIAVIGSLAVLALAACGSNSNGATAASGGTAPQAGAPSAGSGGGQRPAASGLVAAVDGTTMQVQSQQDGQVAVSWGDSTKFSHTVIAKLTSIKAGACVTAIATSGTSQTTSFTATTITLSEATTGQCGGPGGAGGANGVRPSGRPSDRPTGAPSGGPGAGVGGGAFATGKVVSVTGSSLVIAAQSMNPSSGSSAPTTNKTITVGSATKVTTQASTTSRSVVVGKCVSVQGASNSSGAVAATSVRITDADNGKCSSGFGGFNGNG